MMSIKDSNELTKQERFEKIESEKIDIRVYKELKKKFNHLQIEVGGKEEGKLIELMEKRTLQGWCW